MKNEISKQKISNFEKLTETSAGNLVGGFSTAKGGTGNTNGKFSGNILRCTTTNNCNSGNCVEGCGG